MPADKKLVPSHALPYFSIRDELTIESDLVLKSERVVIPFSLRSSVKAKLHPAHMGAESCLRRAKEYVFSPGMSSEIRQLVLSM